MSRPIKFRAWDKIEKRYYYDIQDVYDCGWVPCCCPSFGHFLTVEITDECGDGTGEKRFDVEQFIGLYDATKWEELTEAERAEWTRRGNMPSEWKGKEIYEGDILHTNEADWIAKVIWHYDCFMLTGLNNTGFSCSPDYDKCRIIGNINEDAK